MLKKDTSSSRPGYGFGTFQGVFTPSILTIIGVVMYLRFGWMLGNVGLAKSLLIVTAGSAITFFTSLSISALATNMRVKGGGAYFILSRSLGLEAGAALGLPLALSQTISVSFYVAGFAEALVNSGLGPVSGFDIRIVGLVVLAIIAIVTTISADVTLKSQYIVMAAIGFSLVSFFLGGAPDPASVAGEAASAPPPLGFWPVFAVFFPAVTGILSGLGMSGDLKDPTRSIPLGTISAVATGYVIYMTIPVALHYMVAGDSELLRSDTMIIFKCARWQMPILLGVWAATLSSAIGSFLVAPRVLQALSRDRLLPAFLGRGFGKTDDPRLAGLFCFVLAAIGIWLGDINILAPILTLFNLSTYGLLNFCAALEEAMSNPTWRPTFKVRAVWGLLGFAGCIVTMFMISPGWTFVALFCEGLTFWVVKRRNLRATWGDMRAGLYASLMRFALRNLGTQTHVERNWRPNLLVFSRLPIQNPRFFSLARGLAGGGSLCTFMSVLPVTLDDPSRESEIRDSLARTLSKNGLDSFTRLAFFSDEWRGMEAMIELCSSGPFTPNTLVFGFPKPEHNREFAKLVKLAARRRKNILVVSSPSDIASLTSSTPAIQELNAPIDIWWRGGGGNGPLMLALAFMLSRRDRADKLRMNMIIRKRTADDARAELDEFLKNARIDADVRIFEIDSDDFTSTILANSADSGISLFGLRMPLEDESPDAYSSYLSALHSGLNAIPHPLFVLAAENIDFRRIFA